MRELSEEILVHFGSVPNPVAQGQIKVEFKTALLKRVLSELAHISSGESNQSEEVLFSLLKGFRLMCREAAGCESHLNSETIDLLWKFGSLDETDATRIATRTSIESLKCLANVQVIMPSIRVLFSEYPKLPTLVTALQLPNHSLGSAFLLLRLLFFATATKTALGDEFVRDGILDTLAEIIQKCKSKTFQDEDWINCDTMISECVKTGFNVTVGSSPLAVSMFSTKKTIVELTPNDEYSKKFYSFLSSIVSVFVESSLSSPLLSAHGHIINTMMNIPVVDPTVWFPEGDYKFLDVLLDIFEQSFKDVAPEGDGKCPDVYCDSQVDQALIPMCVLLQKLTVIPEALKKIKSRLLPANINRKKNLGEGPHLTAALIRTMTSVHLSQTRDFLCELMLACFDGDVERFVHYVGYANAAGYLFTKGITTPQAAGATPTGTREDAVRKDGIPQNVDPMTGRFREKKPDPFAGMTDEEKEREAERLFVLFDRLNKTGVIKMETK